CCRPPPPPPGFPPPPQPCYPNPKYYFTLSGRMKAYRADRKATRNATTVRSHRT
ncbi:unnamed protein product, partial [Candidula unifasciata]